MQSWSFFLRLYKFNPKQITFSCLMMVVLSFFEGLSIIAIIPIMSLTGLYHQTQSSVMVSGISNLGLHDLTLGSALSLFILLVSLTALLKRQQVITNAIIQQKFNTHLSS